MEIPDFHAIKANIRSPWEPFPDVEVQAESDITGYDLELVREVGPKHPLFPYKSRAIPIAARTDCDDRLYWIPNPQYPFAVVHLTWAGEAQQLSSDHPTTQSFSSLQAWQEHMAKH